MNIKTKQNKNRKSSSAVRELGHRKGISRMKRTVKLQLNTNFFENNHKENEADDGI